MPRYYCDYCDVYLTHDSAAVRKAHNTGRKHKSCVRDYYAQFEENVVQAIIDTRIREYEARESAIRAGLLPPNAHFTSVMPPHPLAAGVPPALPPGWESGTPAPMPSIPTLPPAFLLGASAAGMAFPFPLPAFPGMPPFPGMPAFPGMPQFPGMPPFPGMQPAQSQLPPQLK